MLWMLFDSTYDCNAIFERYGDSNESFYLYAVMWQWHEGSHTFSTTTRLVLHMLHTDADGESQHNMIIT